MTSLHDALVTCIHLLNVGGWLLLGRGGFYDSDKVWLFYRRLRLSCGRLTVPLRSSWHISSFLWFSKVVEPWLEPQKCEMRIRSRRGSLISGLAVTSLQQDVLVVVAISHPPGSLQCQSSPKNTCCASTIMLSSACSISSTAKHTSWGLLCPVRRILATILVRKFQSEHLPNLSSESPTLCECTCRTWALTSGSLNSKKQKSKVQLFYSAPRSWIKSWPT